MVSDKILKNIEFTFKGENFCLWPAKPEHAKDLLDAVDESVAVLREFLPWAHWPESLILQEQVKRLAKAQYDFYLGNEFIFHLYSGSQKLIGSFGLHRRTLNPKGLELGYWVRKSAMGKGLATAASQVLIVFSFEYLACQRLQCGFNENNLASERVNQKIGFIREGLLAHFEAIDQKATKMGPHLVLGRLLKEEALAQSWYKAVKESCCVHFYLGNNGI